VYGDEIWILRNIDEKYMLHFGMWCWRRTERISWIEYWKNECVLCRVRGKDYPTYSEEKEV